MKRRLFAVFAFLFLCSSSFALVRWSLSATDAVNDNPLIMGNDAIFTSYDGRVYSIKADIGTLSWSYGAGDKITLDAQAIDYGTAAVLTSSGKLLLLRTEDGRLKSEKAFGKPPVSFAAEDGMAFAGFADSIVAANGTGKTMWSRNLTGGTGQIGYSSGRVYFTSSGKLYSVDAATGRTYWETDAGDSFLSRPIESDGAIYFGSTDGSLYAIDRISGLEKWRFKTGGWVTTTPKVAGNEVYFGSNDGYFYSVSLSGKQILKTRIGSGGWTQPEIYSGRDGMMVAFGASDGNIYGLDANNGNIGWSFSTYGKPGSPQMYKQDLVFGTSKGRIYALSPSPICSFEWPRPLDVVGNWPVEIEGKASSDAAIQRVEVRAAKGDWVEAFGEEKWVATVDFSKVGAGTVDVECRATDAGGRMESNEYSTITLVKSDTASPQKMYVFAPFEVMPQENFTLSAKDSRGADLRNVNITIRGEKKWGNSPFSLMLGKSGDETITAEKPGFETYRLTVKGKGDNTLLFALGGILAIAAAAYFLVIRKRLAKKQ